MRRRQLNTGHARVAPDSIDILQNNFILLIDKADSLCYYDNVVTDNVVIFLREMDYGCS